MGVHHICERPDNMKILHVIPAVATRYGGPSRVIIDMCQLLIKAGIETLIVSTDADGSSRLPVKLQQKTTYQSVPVRFFPRHWNESFKYSRPLARWLDENVNNFDAVHIHAIFNHSSLAAARACQRHSIPYIVRPLGSLAPWSMQQKRWQKRLLWHLGVKQMLQGAAAIHYTAIDEQQEAERSLPIGRGVIIPLGIDLQDLNGNGHFQSPLPQLDGHPYVLSLSRLHPKKNLKALLDAFLDVSDNDAFSRWRLVIAGDGSKDFVTSLRQHAALRNAGDRVLFTGWLRGETKAAALRQAALLAMPSYQENFGLAAVEAMACGVPVLVSDCVNLAPEIEAAGSGWVVSLEDGELERELKGILADEKTRQVRGAAGQVLVQKRFTWSAVTGQLIQLYELVCTTA